MRKAIPSGEQSGEILRRVQPENEVKKTAGIYERQKGGSCLAFRGFESLAAQGLQNAKMPKTYIYPTPLKNGVLKAK